MTLSSGLSPPQSLGVLQYRQLSSGVAGSRSTVVASKTLSFMSTWCAIRFDSWILFEQLVSPLLTSAIVAIVLLMREFLSGLSALCLRRGELSLDFNSLCLFLFLIDDGESSCRDDFLLLLDSDLRGDRERDLDLFL